MNVNNSAYCAGAVAARGAANLALQQILGLLPEWRFGIGCRDSTGVGSGRTPVRALGNDGIHNPIVLYLEIFQALFGN